MDIDGFWRLIERSAPEPDRDAWLTGTLRKLARVHIEDFEILLQECRDRIDNAATWAAAYVVYDGHCSGDSFRYFQCWLIGQGRAAFERVAAAPDALATLPAIQRLAGRTFRAWDDDEWPDREALAGVAAGAYPDDSLEDVLAERGFRRRE
ncbi:WGR domain protein [Actinoplanes sp. SE50]|uniref:DUF4240 domain-containing protein n=1 Tax=unclassified Actinoplanes TaxID=2626549 RepID=UPI00023EBBE5|nr:MULTISPECIES: DUF4240 domain-containing protein [unclassified Actinoplanes]AEV86220.1 WGR domain protein [Actinoplanes sp. SE50/110]ATO84618.1 WGR domain protein [Actinoplanes sp. SE50]SLM02028.1 WGR domain protein [Actinoplanes sp. SE50/110]